jgi:hypothetical protein
MAITSSLLNYNGINNCENSGDWTGSTPNDVTDFFKEGTQCVGFEMRALGDNDADIVVTEDLSGVTHLRLWIMLTMLKELNTDGNGGIQVYLSDGVNTGYWYVSGSDTYLGGWFNLCVDLSAGVDAGTKPTMSAITLLGVRVNLTVASKKAQNTWIDHIYAGDGIVIHGDDAGGDFDLDDVLAEDENTSNGWGIIRKIGGVFYIVGSLTFGDNAGTGDLKFKDENEIIVFEDRPVNSALYDIVVVHNATGTGNFQLGSSSGGKGIGGCVFKAEGTIKYKFTCTDNDIDIFKVYGCTFIDSGAVSFPPNVSGREVLSCSFTACGVVDPDTCVVKYCIFSDADTEALLIDTASHNVSVCTFISNPHGIDFAISTTLALDGCLFYGANGSSLYDAEHSVSGSLIINAGIEDNIQTNISASYIEETAGGSTTVNNTVYLRIYCKDKNQAIVSGAQCAIYKTSDDSELMNEASVVVTGLAEEAFNYPGSDVDIYVRVRKSSTGDTKYIPFDTTGKILSTGYNLTIILKEDEIVA